MPIIKFIISNVANSITEILLIALIFSLINPVYPQNAVPTISSYEINADFCTDKDFEHIVLFMNLLNPSHKSEIDFLFSSKIKIYLISAERFQDKIDYVTAGNDSISLRLNRNLSEEDSLRIRFQYSYPVSILSDSINILDRGHRWYPMIADQVSIFNLTCQVPSGYDVLFPGTINRRKEYETKSEAEFRTPFPVFKGSLLIFKQGIYKEFRCDLTGTIMTLYYFPDDSLDIKKIITETGRMMNFCRDYVGKYGSDRLTMVEIPGMDGVNISSGMLMIGSNDLKYINKGYHDGLLLALAEQWFGAGVFSKFGSPGFWITSLSLPHYIRMLYLKETYGSEKFYDALIDPLDKYRLFAGTEKDYPIYYIDMPNTPEKAQVLYIKGPYLFYKLNSAMGDEKWKEFIKELYRTYFCKVMTIDDFVMTLRKIDESGKAANLFNDMIIQPGLPE